MAGFWFFFPRTLLCDYAKADMIASASIQNNGENVSVMGINADSHWFVWHKTVTERYIDNWAGFESWFIHGEQDQDGYLNCSHISLLASNLSMVGNQECFKQMFIVHAAI